MTLLVWGFWSQVSFFSNSFSNMDLKAVNSMNYEEFMDIFGNIVEKCSLITGAIWSKRPFTSVLQLENCVYEFVDSLPPSGKIILHNYRQNISLLTHKCYFFLKSFPADMY
ncbi:hypothetical protein FKM82_009658 [Ascaphus truei]